MGTEVKTGDAQGGRGRDKNLVTLTLSLKGGKGLSLFLSPVSDLSFSSHPGIILVLAQWLLGTWDFNNSADDRRLSEFVTGKIISSSGLE